MRGVARAALWLVGLAALGTALRGAGTGALAAPPLSSGSELLGWVDGRAPATAAVGLVRLTAEVAAWYLLALSLLRSGAALRIPSAARCADLFGLPGTQRLIRAGLGVAATWSLPLSADLAAPSAGAATAQHASDDAGGSATMRPWDQVDGPSAPAGTATMRPAPDRASVVGSPRAAPPTWTVVAGECFWTIAGELVSDRLGRQAGDREVLPYWQRLVEANRARLVDPDDPDLILPGQVLEVPATDHTVTG